MATFSVIVSLILTIYLTINYLTISIIPLSVILFLIGLLLGGLMHMIAITCSADLGQQETLNKNKRATSTVTGIIDGMGTLGSASGPFLYGKMLENYGWQYGFLLIVSIVIGLTLFPLSRVLIKEIREL